MYHCIWFQIILQSRGNKKQHIIGTKNKHLDQDKKKIQDISLHSSSHLDFEKMPKVHIGEKIASSINGASETGYLPVEEWTRPLSLTLHKDSL